MMMMVEEDFEEGTWVRELISPSEFSELLNELNQDGGEAFKKKVDVGAKRTRGWDGWVRNVRF